MVKVYAPLVEMARLHNEINRVFEVLLDVSPEDSLKAASAWVPYLDIVETADQLTLMAELPGVEPDSLQILASSEQVTLKGDKAPPKPVKGARYHCLERGSGGFSRTVGLPVPVNTHQARASLKDGLLVITFPRVPNRRGQAIRIRLDAE